MESKHLLKGLVISLLLLCMNCAFAANNSFNPQAANQTLDKLTIQLSIEELNVDHLEEAVTTLTQLQNQAQNCVTESQENLDEMKKLWDETKPESDTAPLNSVQKYLKDKKDELTARRSECQLFVLRSGDVIRALSETAKKLSTKELLAVNPTLWSKISSSTQLIHEAMRTFDYKNFVTNSGIQYFISPVLISLLLLFLLIGGFIGLQLKRTIKQTLHTIPLETFSNKLHFVLIRAIGKYAILFLISLVFAAVTTVVGFFTNQLTYLMLCSYGFIAFSIFLMFVEFIFHPVHNEVSISGLSAHISHSLITRLKILAVICLIGFICYFISADQVLPAQAIDFSRTIFITLLSISLISILWLINRIPKILNQHRIFRLLINLILTCTLLLIIIAEWLGYQQLVTYVLKGIVLTLIAGFIACLIHKIVSATLHGLTSDRLPFQESIRSALGMHKNEILSEFVIFKLLSYIFIWGLFAIVLLKVWGLSETNFGSLNASLLDGFKVAGLTIIPSRIFSALLFFTLLLLFIRWLQTFLESRTGIGIEKGSQQAFAAIVGYVGFAIVLLISLLIAGVNFAGLAIIAGALSVGIGFGLQSIVNNFVSGIVLLIERPIKPGDRVMIGNTEGFVKKISIRSTQIRTLQRSDLIVPNAEIISQQVTNFMFKDFYGRVDISVDVAYGTDPELVKQTLLEVAAGHPEIVNDDSTNAPIVIFKDFGESALKFALYCIIRNVNLRYIVASELHFAVDKAFKEKGIVIAFPQCDLHIRDWTKKTK